MITYLENMDSVKVTATSNQGVAGNSLFGSDDSWTPFVSDTVPELEFTVENAAAEESQIYEVVVRTQNVDSFEVYYKFGGSYVAFETVSRFRLYGYKNVLHKRS